MGIEPFACSATLRSNGSCILGVVVGDSLRTSNGSRSSSPKNNTYNKDPLFTGSVTIQFSRSPRIAYKQS
jgi:hypothetical protein